MRKKKAKKKQTAKKMYNKQVKPIKKKVKTL